MYKILIAAFLCLCLVGCATGADIFGQYANKVEAAKEELEDVVEQFQEEVKGGVADVTG